MSTSTAIAGEEPQFLVNQVRSDLWKPVDIRYFDVATWENVVNDDLSFHSYRQFIQLIWSRLARSTEDLKREAVALGKLIMYEGNWRFYTTVKSLLPKLQAIHSSKLTFGNLDVLYTYLQPRVAEREHDIADGFESKRFNSVKPMANSLNLAQMREICKVMFGHDEENRLNEQQRRLLKSYIEYAWPQDVVDYTRETDLIKPDDPETLGNGKGKLVFDEILKGLPIFCYLSEARASMRDKPLLQRMAEARKREKQAQRQLLAAEPSADDPPPDLLIELHRSKSVHDVPQIAVTKPTSQPPDTQERSDQKDQVKLRPPLHRRGSSRSKKHRPLIQSAVTKDHSSRASTEVPSDPAQDDLPFAMSPLGEHIADDSTTTDIENVKRKTSAKAGDEPISREPFGGYDGAFDCPGLVEDDSSPEKTDTQNRRPKHPGRNASFTWRQKSSFSVPSPSESGPLTPQITNAAVNGSLSRTPDLAGSFGQKLDLLIGMKENVKHNAQTPGMMLRAAEEAKFARLPKRELPAPASVEDVVHIDSVGGPVITETKPREETEEDWFMPEVKTPGMVTWTKADAKAAEEATAKTKAEAEAKAKRKRERQILKETRSQIKTTREKNELEGPKVVSNPYTPSRRMSPTSLKTIDEDTEVDAVEEAGKVMRFILKRSVSSAALAKGSPEDFEPFEEEDLALIISPGKRTLEEDVRISLERADIDFPRLTPIPKDGRSSQDVLRELLVRVISPESIKDQRKDKPIAVLLAGKRAPYGLLHFEKGVADIALQELDSSNMGFYMTGRGRPGPTDPPSEGQQVGFNPDPEAIEWYRGYCKQKSEDAQEQRVAFVESCQIENEEKRRSQARKEYVRQKMLQARPPLTERERREGLMREVYGEEYGGNAGGDKGTTETKQEDEKVEEKVEEKVQEAEKKGEERLEKTTEEENRDRVKEL